MPAKVELLGGFADEVRISSGAFHHYFDSRRALLEAFIGRIKHEVEQPLLPISHDPNRSAIDKLQGFFDTLDRLRTARKTDVIALFRVWYSDDNAVVRLKVDQAVFAQRAPLLNEIVRQGIAEGSFTTPHPDQAGEAPPIAVAGQGKYPCQVTPCVRAAAGRTALRRCDHCYTCCLSGCDRARIRRARQFIRVRNELHKAVRGKVKHHCRRVGILPIGRPHVRQIQPRQ